MAPAPGRLHALMLAAAIVAACGGSDEDGLFGGSGASGGAASGGAAGSIASGGAAGCATGCAGTGGAAGTPIDAAAGSAGNAGTGGAGGSPPDAGTGGNGGTSASGGIGGNGGTGGSGGGTPTPGTIQCGTGACGTGFNVCCTCPFCPIPYPTTCFPKITGCTGTGKVMTCDDAADCNGGVCCAHFQLPQYTFTGATCENVCPDEGNAQLCTTDAECPSDRACKPLASLPGFKACQPK